MSKQQDRLKKLLCETAHILTQQKFADKHGISQTTVSRWLNNRLNHKKFKMYDASVVEVGGKKFISVKK